MRVKNGRVKLGLWKMHKALAQREEEARRYGIGGMLRGGKCVKRA